MKLHADAASGALNTVTAYAPGWLEINAQRHTVSILVTPEEPVEPLPQRRFEELDEAFFEALAARSPELVLLGTGARQHFPHPRLTRGLLERRIGLDPMATEAAARTYNILMAEGRKVLAVFLIDFPPADSQPTRPEA